MITKSKSNANKHNKNNTNIVISIISQLHPPNTHNHFNAMSLDDLDLDIRNYELRDILNLFKLPSVFTDAHMREAKLTVMRTHPDKSGLDKAYFLFFSKAYKILHEVYQVRAGLSRQKGDDLKYDSVKDDIDARRNANSDKLKRMNADQFNRWFNQTFEENKLHDEEQDSGYGDWLKGTDDGAAEDESENDDADLGEGASWAQRMQRLERRKSKLREQALVVRSEVRALGCSGGYGLARERPEEHSSGTSIGSGFGSSLAYEDLRKAHTESVIPVTHEDYEAVRKYKNMNELQMSRDIDRRTFNYSEADSLMARSQQLQAEDDVRRAFKLAQQDEIVRDINAKWMAHFNAIEN